jgi:hypothetical protein
MTEISRLLDGKGILGHVNDIRWTHFNFRVGGGPFRQKRVGTDLPRSEMQYMELSCKESAVVQLAIVYIAQVSVSPFALFVNA